MQEMLAAHDTACPMMAVDIVQGSFGCGQRAGQAIEREGHPAAAVRCPLPPGGPLRRPAP